MLKKSSIVVLIFIILIGCSDTRKVEEFYENGTLKKVYFVDKETNKMTGILEEFDTLGNLFRTTEYDKGIKKGKITEFYANGKEAFVSNIINDTLYCGSEYEYHENGKIKYYKYRDTVTGGIVYLRFYDTSGNFIRSKGESFNAWVEKKGELFEVEFEVTRPPYCKMLVEVHEILNHRKDTVNIQQFTSLRNLKYEIVRPLESIVEIDLTFSDTLVNKKDTYSIALVPN